MNKKVFYLLAAATLTMGGLVAKAQTSTVATVPDGMMSFPLNTNTTTYVSLPLTNVETYTGVVSVVTTNTISVDETPAPFMAGSLATAAAPYFVKFLSGNEAGRVMLITANTATTLTLDTTDHVSGEAVALTTTNFNVQADDTFEIFPGDTLASVFGLNTAASPLVITGNRLPTSSDTVTIYTTNSATATVYFFNSWINCWETTTSAANANNTIIYPYSAMAVTVRSGHPSASLVVGGRVTQVATPTKIVSAGSVYTSSHYASDVKLSSLNFGSNWIQGASTTVADNLNVWNAALGQFDTYYQRPDSTWRKSTDATTDQSSFTITAGTVTTILKREAVTGAATFLQSALPYTLQ